MFLNRLLGLQCHSCAPFALVAVKNMTGDAASHSPMREGIDALNDADKENPFCNAAELHRFQDLEVRPIRNAFRRPRHDPVFKRPVEGMHASVVMHRRYAVVRFPALQASCV